ncbi:MAG: riboflavin synthase [Gammaproteobacteria bacterium]|nr:riboflavin synthase [Gammaproteobacteria bacterium]
MFTGIIEELGTVKSVRRQSDGIRLSVTAKIVMNGIKTGDSIAVNGSCLTVTELDRYSFTADVSGETVNRTNIGKLRVGDKVNLERPMMLSDRLGGHLVSGHVDAVGLIRGVTKKGDVSIFTFEAPKEVSKYLIFKGSVAVDGISLTVNEITGKTVSITVIPHTLKMTTLGFKKIGDTVNLEADMIGKYIEAFSKS